jgi:hypothetical protein
LCLMCPECKDNYGPCVCRFNSDIYVCKADIANGPVTFWHMMLLQSVIKTGQGQMATLAMSVYWTGHASVRSQNSLHLQYNPTFSLLKCFSNKFSFHKNIYCTITLPIFQQYKRKLIIIPIEV